MKLSHLVFILIGAVCAAQSPAMAQTPAQPQGPASKWYAGASLGKSSIKLQTENVTSTLNGNQDTRDTGYKLVGGYQFNSNWAAELQYVDLGQYKYTDTTKGAVTVKTNGLALSGVGIWPVTQDISVLGKLGLMRQSFTGDAVATSGSTLSRKATKITLLAGFGAEYAINKRLRVRAEYEYFGVPTVLSENGQNAKLRTDLLSVGLLYQF